MVKKLIFYIVKAAFYHSGDRERSPNFYPFQTMPWLLANEFTKASIQQIQNICSKNIQIALQDKKIVSPPSTKQNNMIKRTFLSNI